MLNSLKKFLDLCADYLSENVESEQFKETFEMYMFDYGDDIEEEVFPYLDNILEAVTYFDSPEFREDDEHFLSEEELRDTVQENLEKIKAFVK